ncbi:MAG TPA: hypothetical protein VFE58_06430 [Tepidisphaeraceae bacterium]|jgi:hypothetical protein|nr:hypothetical protein [Tepidisphaeraceae bacterium]
MAVDERACDNETMRSESPAQTAGVTTRSAIQFTLLPLFAGLMIGLGVDYAIWNHSTSYLDSFIFLLMMVASYLYFTFAIIVISAIAAVMDRTSVDANAWRIEPRRFSTIVLLGLSYAIVPVTLAAFANRYWSGNPSAIPTVTPSKDFLIPLGLVLPFFLVKRQNNGSRRRKQRVVRWAGAIILCVGAFLAVLKRGTKQPSRDQLRDCNTVVAWVRSTHSDPGDYKNLTLPPSLDYLSNDGRVEAVLLTDGRVILLFQSEKPWISFCRYTLFSSTSLTGYEVGTDHPDPWFTPHWGYPELRVTGLPNFCIFSKLSPNYYVVGMNN